MLERKWAPIVEPQGGSSSDPGQEFISFRDIIGFLRQYSRSIVASLAVGLLGASFYIATTDPLYTATTQMLIEPKIPQLLQTQATDINLSLDTAQIESQLAVLRSEKIAMMVIGKLGLREDKAFNRPRSPSLAARFARLGSQLVDSLGMRTMADFIDKKLNPWAAQEMEPEGSDFESIRRTMNIFSAGLNVSRVGVSYAIEISFSSPDAHQAARIANATADAFVQEQLQTKAAAAREGGAWLERRIAELRTQMNKATQIAQEFRARHDYSVTPLSDDKSAGENGAAAGGPTLEELEVTADTYKKMYESFLQAFTSSVSQQSYAVADARVITAASRPLAPSRPRKKLVLAFGLLAGLMVGAGQAFARYMFDPSMRSARQVREELGLASIGSLPSINLRHGGFAQMDEVAQMPQSLFSESLRRIRTAINLAETVQPIRCIGVTSALPGEGKSSLVSNLAILYTMSGMRTLVIDADIQNPSLTTRFMPDVKSAPGSALEGDISKVAGHITDVERLFDFLPATIWSNRLPSSKEMGILLNALHDYDMIVIDLPSLAAGAENLSLSAALDGVVIATLWGKTSSELVQELSRSLQAIKASVAGVVLTRAPFIAAPRLRKQTFRFFQRHL
ncbi:MAG: GNVR domain-containing protein [Phyllobacterium sp.]